ncbi:uncharacterized protein LOC127704264 [Mytilus californianus]|uniref:uncharacterized protein LOC127704264 n=1 Tax=Mytilus californianus TaxID=6549 RepID=UPI002247BD33|nr:uncharacterized protein LOC127704264 [Mytilus californianus]
MAQGYPFHIQEYPLYYIGLKYLPESALEELADLLDVPGIVCMELFAEMINREHENKLGLHTSRVQAFRYQVFQRPTKILFRHLMAKGITIGQVQCVLDKMGAATRDIFRKCHTDCIQMFCHDMAHHSTSTTPASENNCTCTGCGERSAYERYNRRYLAERYSASLTSQDNRRPDGQRQHDPNNQRYMEERFPSSRINPNPHNRRSDGQRQNDPNNQRYVAERSPPSGTNQTNRRPDRQKQNNSRHDNTDVLLNEGRLPYNVLPGQRENLHAQPGQREIEIDWIHPSECDCQCGDTNCKECEERRLLDPDETTVLSSYPRREYRNQPTITRRSNNLFSRTTGHVPVNNEMNINDDIQTDHVSYSENPSSSLSLRACPDGNSHSSSMKSSIISKHACSNINKLKCTCKKPPECTCRKEKVHLHKQISQPSSSSSGDNRNRWSTPEEMLYAREIDSSRLSVTSISDSNLCPYPGNRRTTEDLSGKTIFISYTDDAKADVINLAGQIKRQGHSVNTDLHKESFVSAKNQGFVSEKDQYTWLRNRYTNADYIIICSSKGYIEAINLDKVCPSPHYLNARYIFDLIMLDPRKSEKTIEICFQNTHVNDKLCLPFTRKFILPNEMASLSDQIQR